MQILFAISILCFIALVWAGVAIARHIAAGHKSEGTAQGDFAHHLFTATAHQDTRRPRVVQPQTMRDVAAKKGWNASPAPIEVHPTHEESSPSVVSGRRKSPQTSHQGASERLDWAYFNKDAGDLTDPYQTRRFRDNSGARATSPKRY
jgi:hypothetical protein